MTQWVKVLVTKPVDLSVVPGAHMVEEELLKFVLTCSDSWKLSSDLHTQAMAHPRPHMHTLSKT